MESSEAVKCLLTFFLICQVFSGKQTLGGKLTAGSHSTPFGYFIEGDSIPAGLVGHQWSEDFRTNLNAHAVVYTGITNQAQSGDTMANMVTEFANQELVNSVPGDLIILEAGTNDIHPGGQTSDQVISSYTNFSNLCKVNGRRFFPVTILPRSIFTTGESNIALAVNLFITNSVNSGWAPEGTYDAARDFPDSEDSTYFADGTHLNDVGERRFQNLFYPYVPK